MVSRVSMATKKSAPVGKSAAKKEVKPAAEKRSVGRPTDYKAEYAEKSRKLCLLGATDKELAEFFEVCEDTINEWKRVHPEFSLSIKEGKQEADSNVADRLYKRAMGYTHDAVKIFANPTTGAEQIVPFTEHYAPDTAACIFWLKNRQKDKWRDKQDHEHSGPNGGPQQHEHKVEMTAEEAYRRMLDVK